MIVVQIRNKLIPPVLISRYRYRKLLAHPADTFIAGGGGGPGAIPPPPAPRVVAAGAGVLVAGTAVFAAKDYRMAMDGMRGAA